MEDSKVAERSMRLAPWTINAVAAKGPGCKLAVAAIGGDGVGGATMIGFRQGQSAVAEYGCGKYGYRSVPSIINRGTGSGGPRTAGTEEGGERQAGIPAG